LSPPAQVAVRSRPRDGVNNAIRLIEADAHRSADTHIVISASSRIEGIGRPRVEPSFLPEVVDRMVSVPDAASIAAARHASAVPGRRVGASTGTNLWGAFGLLAEMVADGRSGSVVTLLADSGDRYADTYFCDEWLKTQELDTSAPATALPEFERSGHWD
jgi:cysteine synthase